MVNKLENLTFDEWVLYAFDHPVDDHRNAWYWNDDAEWWDCPSAQTVQFLTQAFENAATVLQPYTDAQLNQGLWFIASNACSNHMFALMDEAVPWPERKRCIQAI